MWELDCEESWVLKNWCFWTVVLEKTLESPLDCKEIQPVHFKGDQPWVFFGRNDAKAETPILWPPDVKSWLIGKDSDAGMDWGQEEKGTTEDEMAGWHHWLDGCESEGTLGVGDGRGGLACWDSGGCKESIRLSDWTEGWEKSDSWIHGAPLHLFLLNLHDRHFPQCPAHQGHPGAKPPSVPPAYLVTFQCKSTFTCERQISTLVITFPFFRWGKWGSREVN